MPKIIDDVVVPERRRSIRNISIADVRKKPARATERDDFAVPPPPPPRPLPPLRPHSRRPRKIFWAILGAAIIFTITTLSLVDGATLSYVPRQAEIAFEGNNFSAFKAGESLIFSVVKLSGDKGVEVAASGEAQVERKATGTIVVYNDSTSAQELIATTRFESPEGKIYRIANRINVPAKGSVETAVTADVAGPESNLPLTDFTIPGLKGTARFTSIYGRSKTPMAGGFKGVEKVVDSQTLLDAKSNLETTLSQELLSRAKAEVPAEFILFPSLSSLTFEDLPQGTGTTGNAVVNIRGNLYGIMFKRSDLSLALASSKIEFTPEDKVMIESLDTLELSYSGSAPGDLAQATQISFNAQGSALVVWQTDEAALRSDLAGRDRSEITEILKNYPTVEKASATIKPFWKSSFPEDSGKIEVRKLDNE